MIAGKEGDDRGSALVAALMRPETYPNRPPRVELRETHISRAFLAGEYVYKIKKPVRFSFVDASTLGRRLHLCEEEVRLNRRLAPDIYLGVVPILVGQGRPMSPGGRGSLRDGCQRSGAWRARGLPPFVRRSTMAPAQ